MLRELSDTQRHFCFLFSLGAASMLIRTKGGCGKSSSSPRTPNAHCHRVRRVQSLPGGLQDLREGTALGPGHRPPRFWLFSTTASLHFPTPSIGGMRPPQVEPDADLQTLASSTYAPAPRLTSFGMGARGLDAFAVCHAYAKCRMFVCGQLPTSGDCPSPSWRRRCRGFCRKAPAAPTFYP